MIKNKYLRKLAKNKTEITTSMVCEAERLEWEKFKDLAMSQRALSAEEMMRVQRSAMIEAQQSYRFRFSNPYHNCGMAGAAAGFSYHPPCPFCGK